MCQGITAFKGTFLFLGGVVWAVRATVGFGLLLARSLVTIGALKHGALKPESGTGGDSYEAIRSRTVGVKGRAGTFDVMSRSVGR